METKDGQTGRLRLLDLFCGAGGCSMGYHRAGFEIVGVDINPQPNYPFSFVQGDALAFLAEHGHKYDAIHASPPCQRYSKITKRHGKQNAHPDHIAVVRELMIATGKPWVIENVPGAPLRDPVTLCGSMFDGLKVRRHRNFESNFWLQRPYACDHSRKIVGVYGNTGGSSKRDGIKFGGVEEWREAMGIDWMNVAELAQAIPPAYTEFIGRQLLDLLSRRVAA